MIPRMRQGVLELDDTQPTRVVHCKRSKYDVYIGRDAHGLADDGWGNPFIIGRDGTREEVLALYREWAPRQKWLMAARAQGQDPRMLVCAASVSR